MIQTIFMVGARGAGKTTVGKLLAQAMDYQFIDTDLFIQQATKMSIAQVVAEEGWPGFRGRETRALKTVTQPSTIVATGGGIILDEENRRFMRQHGTVIYLRSPAGVLACRLEEYPNDDQRPTLTGQPIAEEMREVLAAREMLYQDAAHYVMDGSVAPQQVVAQILAVLPRETVR